MVGAARTSAARLRQYISSQTGWRRRGLACAAGSLSVLAMAPFFLWPVLFLTLPVLVWLIDAPAPGQSPLRAATHDGWWYGFGYFFFGLFWIGEAFLVEADIFAWMIPFAITLMPAGLAVFTAAACAAAKLAWRPGLSRILVLAVTMALAEYLRGHVFTGFPWNILGYALTGDDIAMQAAGIFGIYGLTLWTVVICATPLVMLATVAPPRDVTTAIVSLTVLPLAALYAYGFAILPVTPLETVEGVKIRIVQPSVPQHHKWAREKQGEIFNDHLILSRTNEAGQSFGLAGITHVVWPEAAMPFLPLATPQAISAIGELLPPSAHLVAGALRLENSNIGDEVRPGVRAKNKVFNSMIVFGPDGQAEAIYDKVHLVPFGEYLPFSETLEQIGLEALTRIRGGFAVGPRPRPLLAVPGLPAVGPLICYEAIFPGAVIQGNERPDLLINVTNDGWFGNTTGPYQHMHQSRLRAVEEGLPLVRAANNGVSAMIDPYGRLTRSIALNVRGVIDVSLPKPRPMPVYARYGELSFLVTLMLFALAAQCLLSYPFSRVNIGS
ncbi:MAG: apolipoprotein N-acyltransferase [Alphaproteobacteria bacterium BRH_c36]|nr:MAG: apolipoprotein N-acyltransferase [Alphaproteobacteria bacterium BRH_c36]